MTKKKVLQVGTAGIWRYDAGLREARSAMPNGIHIEHEFVEASPMFGSALPLALHSPFRSFEGYDIVHNLSAYPFYPKGRKNFTLVTTAHEMQPCLYPELTKTRLRTFSDVLWEELVSKPGIRCLLSSDYVMATSMLTMEGVIKGGFDRSRVFLTPLGLDRRFFRPAKRQYKERFRVGAMGTITPQKNTLFSIKAVRDIEDRDLEFEIWGKSTYGEEELLKSIGGDKRIKLMGRAPDERIVDIYDSFDALVFPSLFEGFGIPIIEAKARGVPVILLKGGHISPEVKEHCFEARSPAHMAEIISGIKANGYDPRQRKRAIASARKFTWDRTMRETVKAYLAMD